MVKSLIASAAGILICYSNSASAEPSLQKYNALDFEDNSCEISLPVAPAESGIFCGQSIRREAVLRNTFIDSKRCEGWGRYCSAQIFRHSIIYKDNNQSGTKALAFYFVNKNVSDRFTESLAAWLENVQPRPMQWEKGK